MGMRIVIVGAGIGGLAAALALEQAGHQPEVFERGLGPTDLRRQGVFLTLAVNGQQALRALGAAELAATTGFPTGGIRFASGGGKLLGTLPIGPTLPDGTTARTVRRADLIAGLHALATERGIPVRFGAQLEAVEELPHAVTARFADGTSAEGDLLIGADGISSTVRRLVLPDAPAPRFTGVLNAGGFARVPGLDWDGGDYWMTWGHRCFFGHTVAPDGQVWWFANPPAATEPAPGELAERPSDAVRAELVRLLEPDAGPGAQIVSASEGDLQLWAQHDLPALRRWHTARTLLIGDAAHAVSPTTGQGAALALEDAVVLGRCLAPAARPSSGSAVAGAAAGATTTVRVAIEPALVQFEAARRDRTKRIAAWGRRTGNTKTAGPIGRRITDLMMPPMLRLAGSAASQRRQAWIHAFDPERTTTTPTR